MNWVFHVLIFTHITWSHCTCAQPAVNAVLWCRFHTTHCAHCLAVNISGAGNKQATAEIQQQYAFRDEETKSRFPVGPELIGCEWKRTKKGKRNSLNWQCWVKSVKTCRKRGTDTYIPRSTRTYRQTRVHTHKTQRQTYKWGVEVADLVLVLVFSLTHIFHWWHAHAETHILGVIKPCAKNCWPSVHTSRNTHAQAQTHTHTHTHIYTNKPS